MKKTKNGRRVPGAQTAGEDVSRFLGEHSKTATFKDQRTSDWLQRGEKVLWSPHSCMYSFVPGR